MVTKTRPPHRYLVLGICLSGVLVLSACGLGSSSEPSLTAGALASQLPVPIPSQTPVPTEVVEPTVSEEEIPSSESDQEGVEPMPGSGYPAPENELPQPGDQFSGYPAPQVPQSTPVEQADGYPAPEENSPPPLKTELVASDPSTFNIASGKLQLVEFFAFW